MVFIFNSTGSWDAKTFIWIFKENYEQVIFDCNFKILFLKLSNYIRNQRHLSIGIPLVWVYPILSHLNIYIGNRNNSVGIMARLRAGRPGTRDSIYVTGGDALFLTSSRAIMGSTQPPMQWVSGALSPGIKRQNREADNLPSYSSEVKNACNHTFTLPYEYVFMTFSVGIRKTLPLIYSNCAGTNVAVSPTCLEQTDGRNFVRKVLSYYSEDTAISPDILLWFSAFHFDDSYQCYEIRSNPITKWQGEESCYSPTFTGRILIRVIPKKKSMHQSENQLLDISLIILVWSNVWGIR